MDTEGVCGTRLEKQLSEAVEERAKLVLLDVGLRGGAVGHLF